MGVLGRSLGVLGRSLGMLGRSLDVLGVSLGVLGQSLGRLGRSLNLLGLSLGALGLNLDVLGSSLGNPIWEAQACNQITCLIRCAVLINPVCCIRGTAKSLVQLDVLCICCWRATGAH